MLKHVRSSEDWNSKGLGDKGFTLIELLVVIIILGILAAVVVLAVNGITDKGETNACKTEKKTVEAAAAAYYADTDSFPATSTQLLSTTPPKLRDPKFTWSIDAASGEATATGVATGSGAIPANCN